MLFASIGFPCARDLDDKIPGDDQQEKIIINTKFPAKIEAKLHTTVPIPPRDSPNFEARK
jgi:hypothetical protein